MKMEVATMTVAVTASAADKCRRIVNEKYGIK